MVINRYQDLEEWLAPSARQNPKKLAPEVGSARYKSN